ncbi:unnamed protein product [Prunus armeniaca]
MELKKELGKKAGTSRGFRFQRVLSTRQGVGLSAWFPRRSGAGSGVSSSPELGLCRIRWSLSIGKCGTEDGWPLLVRLKAWRVHSNKGPRHFFSLQKKKKKGGVENVLASFVETHLGPRPCKSFKPKPLGSLAKA